MEIAKPAIPTFPPHGCGKEIILPKLNTERLS
jgi:hypothetical protein